jgi:hypothetical protein
MEAAEIRNFRVYLIATLPLWFFAPLAFVAGYRLKYFDIGNDRTVLILIAVSLLLSALIGLVDFEYLRGKRVQISFFTWIANLVAPVGYFFLRAFATVKTTGAGFGVAVLCTFIWAVCVGTDVVIDGAVEDWISPYTLWDLGFKCGFMIVWAILFAGVFALGEKVVSLVRGK